MKNETGYEIAKAFQQRHYEHRAKVRKQSETANPKRCAVRMATMTAIVSLHQSVQGRQYTPTDTRMHLIAQYLQGIELSYASIMEGLYAQAASLQKQQIETLAAIEEYDAGKRVDGKTPNPRNVNLKGVGRQYGALNNAAHPSNAALVESLCHFEEGDRQGPTTIPQFNQDFCGPLLSNHNVYLLLLWRHMSCLFSVVFGLELVGRDTELTNFALSEMRALGDISSTET